jgi:hypothetical protein
MSRSLKIAVPSVDSALVVGIVGAKATAVAAMAFGLIDLSSCGGGPPLGEASPRAAVGEVRAQLSACPTPAVFASDLTSPRNLKFGPDGLLYVAGSGLGGNMKPDGKICPPVDNMFTVAAPYSSGYTSKVSRVWPNGRVETVVDRLPSSRDGTVRCGEWTEGALSALSPKRVADCAERPCPVRPRESRLGPGG